MITRKQFAEEQRRIKQLERDGWRPEQIKSWLRGWRNVGGKT